MESVEFYRSFHTHPLNKFIHLICIPMIVLTTINFMSKFFIVIIKNDPIYLGSHKIKTDKFPTNLVKLTLRSSYPWPIKNQDFEIIKCS